MQMAGGALPRPLLFATWDGAGNLPPLLALVEAFARRGHEIHVLGHDVQRPQIEAAGAVFARYETARQWDQGLPSFLGADPVPAFLAFNQAARDDFIAVARRVDPAAALVDCMLPEALAAAKSEGLRSVALVHALYSFLSQFGGGVLKGPIDGADLALGLSYGAFDVDAAFPANLVFVGPPRPATSRVWKRRLPGRPFVVASVSTGLQGAEGAQLNLLQRICDAVGALEIEALVTTGRGIAPEELAAGANTAVERSVPHEAVLGEADLMVTHAGHGSVMAALRFGVPMLCLPPGADQPANAAKVTALGLGETLDPASSAKEIAAAITRLLADPALKARSRAFAKEVAGHPGIEAAIGRMEALIA